MNITVGKPFPNNAVDVVTADNQTINTSISDWAQGSPCVVFFYPKDFTFVCPTEIVAFDQAMSEFEKRGVKVIGGSVDTAESHTKWRNTALKDGGIGQINYPLLADNNKALSEQLGILNEEGLTYRASYLLSANGTIRHMIVNDMPIGRSVTEMLRIIDAMQFSDEHGEVCPANWQSGEEAIQTTTESTGAYLAKKHGQSSSEAA